MWKIKDLKEFWTKKNQILKFDERPVVLNIGITHKVVLSLESRK